MARILLVDDDAYVLEVVERALRRQGHIILVAHNGKEALEILRNQTPDLAILDIVMPHLNGIEVCKFIRTHPSLASIPILFLTQKERIEDKIEGFEAGADDYLTKPFSLAELEVRVKALLRYSSHVVPTGPLAVGKICVDPHTGKVEIDGSSVELTPVEFELLYFLVSHAGEVLSTERLLQEVWGYPPGAGNPSLVRMHVLNLRRKIEPDPRHPIYIRTIPRHGYTIPLAME
ncbi:MAG: response regulator transcription factor [Anaerolineae bacterium]|nr:response regulator transcription factor [Anaerolineae bacterium]